MALFMEQLIIVFNAVAPFFLIMGLGWFVRRREMVSEKFFPGVSKVAFFCLFPTMLFLNIYRADLAAAFDPVLVSYLVGGTVLIYAVLWFVSARFIKDKQQLVVFVHAGHRGNYIVLALPIVGVLMGPEALPTTALMLPLLVTVYNILAATLFVVNGLDNNSSGFAQVKDVLLGILKMPMIIAAIIGLTVNFSGLSLPVVVERGFSSLVDMAAPAGLIAIGGALSMEKMRRNLDMAIKATVVKNLLVPLVFIVPAVLLGFRGIDLAIIAMTGLVPVTPVTYVLAVEMGGDADSAASCLILSNVAAIFTVVPALAVLRMFGLF